MCLGKERESVMKEEIFLTNSRFNEQVTLHLFFQTQLTAVRGHLCAAERSTDVGHLRDGGAIRAALEQRWVVVDVLHTDDELG